MTLSYKLLLIIYVVYEDPSHLPFAAAHELPKLHSYSLKRSFDSHDHNDDNGIYPYTIPNARNAIQLLLHQPSPSALLCIDGKHARYNIVGEMDQAVATNCNHFERGTRLLLLPQSSWVSHSCPGIVWGVAWGRFGIDCMWRLISCWYWRRAPGGVLCGI